VQITLKQLETFVWIAALRNFRRVAEHLNTTQPNISARLAALEDLLGVKLFERDSGSVEPTEEGRALLPHAHRVLAAAEGFVAAGNAAPERALLHLGVAEMVAHTWLHDFLDLMRREHPSVVVDLVVGLSVDLRRGLLDRTIDLALINGPLSDLEVTNLPLGTVGLAWVGTPALVDPLDGRADAATLAGRTVLTHARSTRPHLEVADYFRRNDCLDVRIASSSNMAACLQMALDGLGIAVMPEPIVAPWVAAGRLRWIACDFRPTPMTFTASWVDQPPRRLMSEAARLAAAAAVWTPRNRPETLPLVAGLAATAGPRAD
jgi:DNA-binding transcriptional LysR family regulator